MKDLDHNLEQILERVTFDDSPDQQHQYLLEQKLLLNYPSVQARHHAKWRLIMNNKIVKLATAAVVLIGVFAGFKMFKGTGGVSWAQVRQQVAAVKAVLYRATITGMERGQPFEARLEAIQTDEFGTRMDLYMEDQLVNRSFSLVREQSHISLYPAQKRYIEVELTDKIKQQNGDPKLMVEAFLKGSYRKLGRSEIDGVAVEGIETHDISPTAGFPGGPEILGAVEDEFPGEVVGCLWVDVTTGWPVKVTLDLTDPSGQDRATIEIGAFQWNAVVDGSEFASVIPDGYQLMYTLKAGRLESGEQLAEGLAYFAQLTGGRYPDQLTIGGIIGEIGKIYQERKGDASFRVDDGQIVNLKYGAQYTEKLKAQGKQPVYYGQTVQAGDSNKVLLRWKLDGGNYRVIFGDLRIEDIDAARLEALETQ